MKFKETEQDIWTGESENLLSIHVNEVHTFNSKTKEGGKLDEVAKIRGQIAKDLRRLGGVDGFQTEQCYRRLREKYIRGHQSKKKLALLEMERQKWCK